MVDEVTAWSARVRAFSEFASEPPVAPRNIDVNAMLEERIAFLRAAHPEVTYTCGSRRRSPDAYADEDLLKGVLTNLLENAAQAARGGRCAGDDEHRERYVRIEVHDSGPGSSVLARIHVCLSRPFPSKRRHGIGVVDCEEERGSFGRRYRTGASELVRAGFRVILPRVA